MWRQRAVAEGVLPLPCPFIIGCRFIVSVSSMFVHDAHYDYVVACTDTQIEVLQIMVQVNWITAPKTSKRQF